MGRNEGASVLLMLLLSSSWSSTVTAVLSSEDESELSKVSWIDYKQVLLAYKAEFNKAKQTAARRSDILFYPESRVLVNSTVTIFCLMSSDKSQGYRTNRVALQILEEGQIHQRSLLAPKRKLLSHADQLNCWNYAQESVCQPLRDCSNPARPELRTVGIVTREGWGIFQIRASKLLRAHYQCRSETQSILTSQERLDRKLADHTSTATDIQPLEVFDTNIGEPQLLLKTSYLRGQPLEARCKVNNSSPRSEFALKLILMRPPPPGSPGENREEILATDWVSRLPMGSILSWRGELALKSHHGLEVVCRLINDWGPKKGRQVTGQLRIAYMFPAFVSNPRIQRETAIDRSMRFYRSRDNYKTPSKIVLRQAEYAVCKSDGYPSPIVNWSPGDPHSVWILNETMFISKFARVGQAFKARCSARSSTLNMSDEVEVEIMVIDAGRLLPSALSSAPLQAALWYLLQAIGNELSSF